MALAMSQLGSSAANYRAVAYTAMALLKTTVTADSMPVQTAGRLNLQALVAASSVSQVRKANSSLHTADVASCMSWSLLSWAA